MPKILRLLTALALLGLPDAASQRLSPMAPKPDWRMLEKFQESITRADFLYLLDKVYAPLGAWKETIDVGETSAKIRTTAGSPPFVLRFAATPGAIRPAARFWRQRSQMVGRPDHKPLQGIHIAIDPGHIGGDWAKMEERWFQIGDSKPVTEGDMTLHVAKLIVPRLQALGAKVSLTRSKAAPVTALRPERLSKEAEAALKEIARPVTERSLRYESERLFYRVGEIRRRAQLVNEQIKPDVVLCLHFNAEAWGDATRPTLTTVNHLHFLVTGAFSEAELAYDDQRYNMLYKLLSRSYSEELALTESLAAAMAKATGLPPFEYKGTNAVKVGQSPYIWGRNLLANRLFVCPVVYFEPYVMNSREVFARIQAGDYKGRRNFGGVPRESIYQEYANAVVQGLLDYYSQNP